MASKKNKNQLSLNLTFKDRRIPKLIGLVLLFLAAYLFVAFTSYLFTWRDDYDDVNSLGFFELLSSDTFEPSNLLGKLGAIVSNTIFWWGIGLSSFIFIYLLVIYGSALIKERPLGKLFPSLRNSLLLALFISVFLEFVFGDAEFPWGGAIGEVVSEWMTGFVGVAGMTILYLFLIVGIVIWRINPDFNNWTPQGAWEDLKLRFQEFLSQPFGSSKKKTAAATADATVPVAQRPEVKTTTASNGTEMGDFTKVKAPESNREKPKPLRPGDSEFEVEDATAKPPEAAAESSNPGQQASLFPEMAVADETKNFTEPYDPTLELSSYEYPVVALLKDYNEGKVEIDRTELEANKDQIVETLLNYKIEITKIRATIGPTVTLYEIVPAAGVRISRIKNLEDDIALSLAALGIRIIAPIPGRGTIGIEVPNKNKQIVALKELLMSDKFKRAKMDLPIALGKTIANEVYVVDLAKMPHLLIAGATGQGKSVGINAILLSILYKKHPSQVKLVLIDPKKVELFPFAKLFKHFLAVLPDQDEPITTETNKVVHTLNSLTIEMEERYNLMKKAHVRNITEYNEKFVARKLNPNNGHRFMPFIVLVIDEFADLIMTAGKEIELPIGRLAQLARAVGIHLIIATQRPSVNIITGVIKANFPARIAFKVSAKVDSRTILDASGAEQLVGRGDMLFSVGGDMIRLQCAFVDTPEVENVIKFISDQQGYPEPYLLPEFHGDDEGMTEPGAVDLNDLDDLIEDAARLVVQSQHGSTSMIQRRLKLGYNRAGRIMDQLEALGIVGPAEGSKPREVLVYDEMELERYLKDFLNRK
jgi:S-DNA-T family DNA segregation ATPase FtsK/SpoIIIE